MWLPEDTHYMRLALRLARRGRGQTSPNPMVGAVLVRDGAIVGQGYHRRPGEAHAEIMALKGAGQKARRATLYVNLEPCCFQGRTPPCTEQIIRQGVSRVICGQEDPNPKVSGKGLTRLRECGIDARSGLLEKQARELNEAYNKHISTGLPFVVMKLAQTLDGQIATRNGDARWISSPPARRLVHRLRSQCDAVLVGLGTIRRDDPQLNVRHVRGSDPVKVIMDSRLRTPLRARVLSLGKTIIAVCQGADSGRVRRYEERGIEIWEFPPDRQGRVDLSLLLKRLGQRGVTSLLLEGGQRLCTTALRSGLVDKLLIFIGPRLLGAGRGSLGDLGIRRMADALPIREMRVRRVGPDVLIVGWL